MNEAELAEWRSKAVAAKDDDQVSQSPFLITVLAVGVILGELISQGVAFKSGIACFPIDRLYGFWR